MPVRFLLEKVPAQCDGVIKADPFLLPTRKFPAGISPEDQQRLTSAITGHQRSSAGIPGFRCFHCDEPTIQSETDRYIAWPAQALSYKLGQLKFRELRDRAQRELGAKFDIRSFHDEMLSGGVLPLDLLDTRTDDWIHAIN
jgi:uncharacterized protein (DUF885 family)